MKTNQDKLSHSFSGATSSSMATSSTSKTKKSTNLMHSTSHHRYKPAELYRTDFITAMKLPDTEFLDDDGYWLIRDQWKLDWEKGVQVPVKPEALARPNFSYLPDQVKTNNGFKSSLISMPKKYLCPISDKNYKPEMHQAYLTHNLLNTNSKTLLRYDCDDMDMAWLSRVNNELQMTGIEKISSVVLESLIENFETQSNQNLKAAIDKFQSYSIEYDEGIVCDVCHSPDSDEYNEMVFCDGCNMCVHQTCYGIEKIPRGNWLCAPCLFGGNTFKPECVLCPNTGGALKSTKNYRNWAHVSCVLWIPETGFADPNKMDPIVNLNQISSSRWHLVCSLCKEKRGCCLQCSEKRCHAAFHVTCGFKHNLEMQTSVGDDNSLAFKAYCFTHTKKRQLQKQNNADEDYEEEDEEESNDYNNEDGDNDSKEAGEGGKEDKENLAETNFLKEKLMKKMFKKSNSKGSLDDCRYSENDQTKFFNSLATMSETERKLEIFKEINLLNYQFFKQVNLDITKEACTYQHPLHLELVFNYWKLKRRFNASTITASNNRVIPVENKPLMFSKIEDTLTNQSERFLISRIKIFVKLRQDFEKARNLCYMVNKRERLKHQFIDINHQLFKKQADYLAKYSNSSQLNSSTTSTMQNQSTSKTSPQQPLRSGRLREILQIKNPDCIYDYPELWLAPSSNTSDANSNNLTSYWESDADESGILSVNKDVNVLSTQMAIKTQTSNNKATRKQTSDSNETKSSSDEKIETVIKHSQKNLSSTSSCMNQNLITKRIKNKYDLIKKNKKQNVNSSSSNLNNSLTNRRRRARQANSNEVIVKSDKIFCLNNNNGPNLNNINHNINEFESTSLTNAKRNDERHLLDADEAVNKNQILNEKINKLINKTNISYGLNNNHQMKISKPLFLRSRFKQVKLETNSDSSGEFKSSNGKIRKKKQFNK